MIIKTPHWFWRELSMVVGQSFILGLGKLLGTGQTQSEVFNTF